eukprot:CAMPEP_0182429530 /NCGR_PEP_ID=MMETSP1167-20130531/30153_1 /TAXON_ID=2988 /ORGANISM="Mallomonas Sp, Strain CCMP3275" /LENGTH=64 /DNA_ID=CAMNT_0024613313 /DNA_START=151 /DNA_END=341 /DNA_ORIENTATION=-
MTSPYPLVDPKYQMAWALITTPENLLPLSRRQQDLEEASPLRDVLTDLGVYDASHLPFCDRTDL